ncbi:Transcriptional regulator, MarR family [Fulvivirga imtechensis AK7]|uniref:Transcriptional regulator, MarR family n=1 Tax=Fulvivirga imtechensis AK7 TaxID=1237149 RepID=L8JVU1_9BACT|nr:MarR family winged helix-turn-helix transcriptional regulator [Fulvivirga imtechensis]ELR72298.1 Transcriptional regulator, MarR family [Fulvivirga imtechensis AK7]
MDQSQVEEIRSFNRFYTKIIGLLDKHILNSNYSLPEVRVLFELNHSPGLTASDLITILDIDKGYLSRILKKFEKQQLIRRHVSASDRRATNLSLSELGQREFNKLDNASSSQIRNIFDKHTNEEVVTLVNKMKEIRSLITKKM